MLVCGKPDAVKQAKYWLVPGDWFPHFPMVDLKHWYDTSQDMGVTPCTLDVRVTYFQEYVPEHLSVCVRRSAK